MDSATLSSSSLRSRRPNTIAASCPSVVPTNPRVKSPLDQFSALPPPALRAAEASFKQVVNEVCRMIESRSRMDELERQILRARTE